MNNKQEANEEKVVNSATEEIKKANDIKDSSEDYICSAEFPKGCEENTEKE